MTPCSGSVLLSKLCLLRFIAWHQLIRLNPISAFQDELAAESPQVCSFRRGWKRVKSLFYCCLFEQSHPAEGQSQKIYVHPPLCPLFSVFLVSVTGK